MISQEQAKRRQTEAAKRCVRFGQGECYEMVGWTTWFLFGAQIGCHQSCVVRKEKG